MQSIRGLCTNVDLAKDADKEMGDDGIWLLRVDSKSARNGYLPDN